MSSDDFEYLRARAVEERQRAVAASDQDMGRIHADFARQYEEAAARISFNVQLQDSHDAIGRSLDLLAVTRAASQLGQQDS